MSAIADINLSSSAIGDALFTKTQQRVLGLLYGRSEQSFYLNEIDRWAGVGKGTVRRELNKLCDVGVLTVTRQGNQNHYQANPNNPIFNELRSITLKTFGVADVLKAALLSLADQIALAYVYGSVAKGSEHAKSDIDLLLVADDLSYAQVLGLLAQASEKLGRKINPTLFTRKEYAQRVKTKQHFVTRIAAQPKLWLVGEHENER